MIQSGNKSLSSGTVIHTGPIPLCRWLGKSDSLPLNAQNYAPLALASERMENHVHILAGNRGASMVGILSVTLSFEAGLSGNDAALSAPGSAGAGQLSTEDRLRSFWDNTQCEHTHNIVTFSSSSGDSFGHDVLLSKETILVSSPTTNND